MRDRYSKKEDRIGFIISKRGSENTKKEVDRDLSSIKADLSSLQTKKNRFFKDEIRDYYKKKFYENLLNEDTSPKYKKVKQPYFSKSPLKPSNMFLIFIILFLLTIFIVSILTNPNITGFSILNKTIVNKTNNITNITLNKNITHQDGLTLDYNLTNLIDDNKIDKKIINELSTKDQVDVIIILDDEEINRALEELKGTEYEKQLKQISQMQPYSIGWLKFVKKLWQKKKEEDTKTQEIKEKELASEKLAEKKLEKVKKIVEENQKEVLSELNYKVDDIEDKDKDKIIINKPEDIVNSTINENQITGNLITGFVIDENKGSKQDIEDLDLVVEHKFDNINAISGKISAEGLQKLANNSKVKRIIIDRKAYATLTDSLPLIKATSSNIINTTGYNLTGKGQTVCIVDTGVDYNHESLGDGWGNKVIAGIDYVNVDFDPMDDNGHGTHVAGIAAGNGNVRGIAPEANIAAVKSLNNEGAGSFSDVAAGIEWCYNNKNVYNITVVSLSLSDNGKYTSSDQCNTSNEIDGGLTAVAIENAVSLGIYVVVSSGNNYYSDGISYPSCVANATSVAASDKSDNMASFSNTADFLDIIAPGVNIVSANLGGRTRSSSGTSMAVPFVSGAVALAYEYELKINNRNATTEIIKPLLLNSNKNISVGDLSGLSFPRLDVELFLTKILTLNDTANEISNKNVKISFSNEISPKDLSRAAQAFLMKNNLLSVDSSIYPEFNKTANITFYNLNYNRTPKILRDNLECPEEECVILNYSKQNNSDSNNTNYTNNNSNGILLFNVEHFTNFTTIASNETINQTPSNQTNETPSNQTNISNFYLQPYLIFPSVDKNVSKSIPFNFTAGVRCIAGATSDGNGGDCGNITASIDRYADGNFTQVLAQSEIYSQNESENSSFYSLNFNPLNASLLECLANLQSGESCNVTWRINVTGMTDTFHEFVVLFNSSDSTIPINQTEIITIGIRPKPLIETFDGETTNLLDVLDLSNVSSFTLDKSGYGKIVWHEFVNVLGQNLTENVIIGNGFVSVNSENLDNTLNNSANLTISGVSCPATIYYSERFITTKENLGTGSDCNENSNPRCTNVVCQNGVVSLTVSHFTTYFWNTSVNVTNANFSFIGENAGDFSGGSVSLCGDVNGDGYKDMLMGSPLSDAGGSDSGLVHLVYGCNNESGTYAGGCWLTQNFDLSQANASFFAGPSDSQIGYDGTISSCGDVNNDSYDDILIGGQFDDLAGKNNGQAFLVFGCNNASGIYANSCWLTKNFNLTNSSNATFLGEANGDWAGASVSIEGDVNNDTYNDILIGAYGNNQGGSGAGQTYLIYGCNNNSGAYSGKCWLQQNFGLDNSNATFIGEAAYDYSGFAVSLGGDVNNDSYDDILIGAFGNDEAAGAAGKAYVIYGCNNESGTYTGSCWLTKDLDLSMTNVSFLGQVANEEAGFAVHLGGDVNNDSYADILIGARELNTLPGKVYLVLGCNNESGPYASGCWLKNSSSLSSGANASFNGEFAGDFAARSVKIINDTNNDTYYDILIGAILNDEGGNNAGKAYLVFGCNNNTGTYAQSCWLGFDVNLTDANSSFIGEFADDRAGTEVSGGDVNKDNFTDIMVGSPQNDDGGNTAGKSYIMLSALNVSAPAADNAPTVTLTSPTNNSFVGNEGNITFRCSATDDNALTNITLYHNISGAWKSNITNIVAGTNNQTNFTINNTSEGIYIWNCMANDSNSNSSFASANFTFTVDTTNPSVNISFNHSGVMEYGTNASIRIDWNASDLYLNTTIANVTYPSGVLLAQFTDQAVDINLSQDNLTQIGTYTITVLANDSAGNQNLSTRTFSVTGASCDATIATSITLGSSLENSTSGTICPGDGLIIGTDDIVIDCNDNNITGSNLGAGINLSAYDNITIKRCFIYNFTYGILITNASDNNTINNNTFIYDYVGINISNGTGSTVYHNNFSNLLYINAYSMANNSFNRTSGGVAQGNVWNDSADLDIRDSNLNYYGNTGTQYPYNSTNGGSVLGYVNDYGPILTEGKLNITLVTPTENGNVSKTRFFTWSALVECVSGNCGNVTAILDPFTNKKLIKS